MSHNSLADRHAATLKRLQNATFTCDPQDPFWIIEEALKTAYRDIAGETSTDQQAEAHPLMVRYERYAGWANWLAGPLLAQNAGTEVTPTILRQAKLARHAVACHVRGEWRGRLETGSWSSSKYHLPHCPCTVSTKRPHSPIRHIIRAFRKLGKH